MSHALTPSQRKALAALLAAMSRPMDLAFRSAYALGTHSATLASLEPLGLVERRWATSSLRGGDHWTYRLTTRGYLTAKREARA